MKGDSNVKLTLLPELKQSDSFINLDLNKKSHVTEVDVMKNVL